MAAGPGYPERRASYAISSRHTSMARHSLIHKPLLLPLFAVMLLGLGACAKPIVVTSVQPDGSLEVLGPDAHFATEFESGQWIRSGDIGPASLVVTEKAGKRALHFPSGNQEYTILRPVDAILLSTPYLGWSWFLDLNEADEPDISIIVGFKSPMGTPEEASFHRLPEAAEETPANRALALQWAASALQRGDLALPAPGESSLPRYRVRGGRENSGRWWREGVDLADLYTRLWPGEDPARARIVFVAIDAGSNRVNAPAYFADMQLFR